MPGGRPTNDPKQTLIAVRLSARHLTALRRRARAETISLSEALRRIVDEWERGYQKSRPPTPAERETFKLLVTAFGTHKQTRSKK